MKKNSILCLIVLGLQVSLNTQVQANDSICFDALNNFFVRTPKGWVLDTDATVRLGYCAVFRKEEFKFHTSPAGIYVRILPFKKKNEKGELDVLKFIEEDLEPFQMRTNDRAQVRDEKEPVKPKGLNFLKRVLTGGPPPNEFERLAYLGANEAVLMVVLTARKEEDLEGFRKDFEEVLSELIPRTRLEMTQMLQKWASVDELARESRKYFKLLKGSIEKNWSELTEKCLSAGIQFSGGTITLAQNGKLLTFFAERASEESHCIEKRFRKWRFPSPPFAPFHFELKPK